MLPTQRCQECGYDLSPRPGAPAFEQRCPECGRAFFYGQYAGSSWPGWPFAFITGSGIYLALLVLSFPILLVPEGAPIGWSMLVATIPLGAAGPMVVGFRDGVRYPTCETRWMSRRRIVAVGLGINAAALALLFLLLRLVR
jgi:hypothetical protein